jgi:transcriptional regulator with PAS, ATPase and Fis domain
MRSILNRLPQIEMSDLPVLIVGNSGDGKSHLAEQIADNMITKKYASSKKLINCAAIPENLFESELFGHMKGSFTGASGHKVGLLMAASGFSNTSLESAIKEPTEWKSSSIHKSPSNLPGVIILDELAALPRYCQAKLLSVLDGKPIQPIGYVGPGFAPNFRIVATTNEVDALTTDNRFRQDLRMRLEGWLIAMPPLAKQAELVKRLTQIKAPSFYDGRGSKQTVNVEWTEDAIETLVQCVSSLAGGVRQLQNVIARAAMFAHFSQAQEVTSAFVSKALSQKMPSITKAETSAVDEAQLIGQLIEQWLTSNSINLEYCRSGSGQLSYILIAQATTLKQGKELVTWCIENKTDIAGSERDEAFLMAVGAGPNTRANTRAGIYKHWRFAKRCN